MTPALIPEDHLPALFLRTESASKRFWEFFTANIRNPNTRRAYLNAVSAFSAWCDRRGLTLATVEPIHIAAYVEILGTTHSKPTVKQHLAAIRVLFDWLVTGQIVPINPAASVRGPKHTVKKGKTPVLSADEMGSLLKSIDVSDPAGLRDRAILAVMGYTFARIGATLNLKVEDYFIQKRRGWLRLHEKGGNVIELPCHHNLEQYLDEWLAASGFAKEPQQHLFPSLKNVARPLSQSEVYRMIGRHAKKAGIDTKICCHTFRATGITTYLQNGGKLEIAQQMAGHESPRTTGLYDRRNDSIALDEIERISY